MFLKVVFFDLWNTLVYDPSHEEHERIAELLGFEDRHEFWNYLDKNFFDTKVTFYEFVQRMMKERNLPEDTLGKVEKIWKKTRINVSLFPETLGVLERLKDKYKLVLLSNTAEKEGKEIIERFGLRKYFDKILISGKIGLAKPNPRIFEMILNEFDVEPEEILVVGDNLEMDIIPARTLGMRGILVDKKGKYKQYDGKEWYIKSMNELKL